MQNSQKNFEVKNMSYNQLMFNSQRCRGDKVKFLPPLHLVDKFSFENVAYMPGFYANKFIIPFLDGTVQCLKEDGTILWEIKLSDKFALINSKNGQIIIHNNQVLALFNKQIHIIDFQTGAILDKIELDETRVENAVIMGSLLTGLFYDDNEDYYFGGFDLELKIMLWTIPMISGPWIQRLSGDNNLVVVYDKEEELCCLEVKTGKEQWRRNLKEIVQEAGTAIDDYEEFEETGCGIISNGRFIQPIYEDHIASLDLYTGKTMWSKKIKINNPQQTTLYPDNILYTVDTNWFIMLDAETGETIKEHSFDGNFVYDGFSMPTNMAVSDNTIYVADINKGRILALDKETLEITWSYQIDAQIPCFPGPTIIDGILFVLDSDGNLHAFAEESVKK